MSEIKMSVLRGVGGGDGGEISLVGSLQIAIGDSNTYLINDYDSFSEYTARANGGVTVGINHATQELTVSVDSGYVGDQVAFFVSRSGIERSFTLATRENLVVTPRIISPSNGSVGQSTNLTIVGSSYTTIPSGQGVLEKSRWQISRTQGFTDIIKDETLTTGNKEHYSVSSLPIGTELFVRVMYTSSALGDSAWSNTSSFTTINESINKPTISLDQPTFDVNETPTFIAGAFTTIPANSDSHLSSSWRVVKVDSDSSETIVYTNNRSMSNKQSLTLPKGVLETSSEYYAQVKFEGSSVGESMWSDKLTFTTASSFVPDEVGVPWEGGYYVGRVNVDGTHYAIVLASAQAGGVALGLQWKTSDTNTPNTNSLYNCRANMAGAIAAGINLHPAFKFCYDYRGSGFDDWLLPSVDVLEVVYRNLKPTTDANRTDPTGRPNGANGRNPNSIPVGAPYTSTNPSQTPLSLFKAGGAESIYNSGYLYMWSSSQHPSAHAWTQHSPNGFQGYDNKAGTYRRYVRPVRLVPID